MVADARRLIADALAMLISRMDGFSVAAVATMESALPTGLAERPALAVVGVAAEPADGLELVCGVRRTAPDVEIVMIVDVVEPAVVRFALDQGVVGLLASHASMSEIAGCLDQVVHGHAVLPAGWRRALSDDTEDPVGLLSGRQREVLQLVVAGCSYEEIAARLFISVNTVKFHVRSIYSRLGVHNRMAAARCLMTTNQATPPRR